MTPWIRYFATNDFLFTQKIPQRIEIVCHIEKFVQMHIKSSRNLLEIIQLTDTQLYDLLTSNIEHIYQVRMLNVYIMLF